MALLSGVESDALSSGGRPWFLYNRQRCISRLWWITVIDGLYTYISTYIFPPPLCSLTSFSMETREKKKHLTEDRTGRSDSKTHTQWTNTGVFSDDGHATLEAMAFTDALTSCSRRLHILFPALSLCLIFDFSFAPFWSSRCSVQDEKMLRRASVLLRSGNAKWLKCRKLWSENDNNNNTL